MTWTGVYPAVTTKFTEADRLDVAEMTRCFELQIKAGVDGLITCGSLGEASTLNFDEKIEVLKAAVAAAAGRPVLATVAEGATRDACAMAEAAAKAGAAGLMALPGLPYRSEPHETVAHFRAIAGASDLPIMIYNNPVAYGVDVTPAMFEELADEPKFVAMKESSDDVRRVTEIRRRLGARYRIFTGVDNLALESIAMGADGWVAGLVVAFPAETVAIWRLARAGRLEEAREIYAWFRPLLDLDVSTRLVQNIKCVEALVLGSPDICRAPRQALAGSARAAVKAVVDAALASRPAVPELPARQAA